jgi:protein-L-isoaspartate O-methyltransferase
MRILEVGSGGYNAALIQELVGSDGHVTTVDIDPDVTARARTCLDATGYRQVDVVLADADAGVPPPRAVQAITEATATLDTGTAMLTRRRLEAANLRIDRSERPQLAEYNLIGGLTGIDVAPSP